MNPVVAGAMLQSGRSFFERHGPVDCRDYATLNLMKTAGIPGYHSGCLTLTLTLEKERYSAGKSTERNGVFAVDVLYNLIPRGRKQGLRRMIGRAGPESP